MQNTDPHLDGLTRPVPSQTPDGVMLWAKRLLLLLETALPGMGCLYTRLHAQEGRGAAQCHPQRQSQGPRQRKAWLGWRWETRQVGWERGACFFCWKGLEYKNKLSFNPSLFGSGRVVDRDI